MSGEYKGIPGAADWKAPGREGKQDEAKPADQAQSLDVPKGLQGQSNSETGPSAQEEPVKVDTRAREMTVSPGFLAGLKPRSEILAKQATERGPEKAEKIERARGNVEKAYQNNGSVQVDGGVYVEKMINDILTNSLGQELLKQGHSVESIKTAVEDAQARYAEILKSSNRGKAMEFPWGAMKNEAARLGKDMYNLSDNDRVMAIARETLSDSLKSSQKPSPSGKPRIATSVNRDRTAQINLPPRPKREEKSPAVEQPKPEPKPGFWSRLFRKK